MKIIFTLALLFFSFASQSEIFVVGVDNTCTFHDLQLTINNALVNGEFNNEIRLVNDGGLNQQSFVVDFSSIQGLTLKGGYSSCNDAINDIVSGKTTIDAQDAVLGQPVFTVKQQLDSFELFFSLQNIVLKNSQALSGAGLNINSVKTYLTNVDILENHAQDGAGIYCRSDISIRLDVLDSSINNNHATNNGGGIYLAGNSHIGCQLILRAENKGNYFDSNQAGNNGGALFIDNLVETETIFTTSLSGSELFAVNFGNNSALNGGAMYQSGGLVVLDKSNFDSNHAVSNGGAIYTENQLGQPVQQVTLSLSTSQMINNSANSSGGAIYSEIVRVSMGGLTSSNNKAPVASFADFIGSELYIDNATSVIANHENSQSLIRIRNTPTNRGEITLGNVIIKDNNNIDNLFDVNTGVYFLKRNYVFGNQVNDSLFKKNHTLGVQLNDKFYFNTIADNTVGNAIFSFNNNNYAILDNIIWQPGETPFDINNSFGTINCNILNSQTTNFGGTHNTNVAPQFVNAFNDNYRVTITSRAVDYCQYDQHPPFGFNSQDFDDIDFVDNLFGVVDIGADVIQAFEYIFANSFE